LGAGFDADHLADTPARRVRLEIPKAVGGAGVEAESAMDAAGVIFVNGNETGDGVGGHGSVGRFDDTAGAGGIWKEFGSGRSPPAGGFAKEYHFKGVAGEIGERV
jgi:hypothetical protein